MDSKYNDNKYTQYLIIWLAAQQIRGVELMLF